MRLAIFSLLIAVLPTFAADWPQFRGPTGDGHYTGPKLPTELGIDKNVIWKTPIPGKGWSSPIVWKGKVFLTSAEKDSKGDLSLHALAIDATSGKIEWDQEVLAIEAAKIPKTHSKNGYASPTPTTDGERLYVHFGPMGTAALDLTGKVLWTRTGSANLLPRNDRGNQSEIDCIARRASGIAQRGESRHRFILVGLLARSMDQVSLAGTREVVLESSRYHCG